MLKNIELSLSRLIRPRSVLRLVLAGFFVVALPLIFSIIQAGIYVDRLVVQSQQAVIAGVKATQSSQRLLGLVAEMERRARQFQVVPDPSLRGVFRESYMSFQKATTEMAPLVSEAAKNSTLQQLQVFANEIASALEQKTPDPKALAKAIDHFEDMARLAQTLVQERDRSIDKELKVTQAIAEEAQRALTWKILALIPTTALLILLFTYVIAGPIRQIDRAIHQLGEAGLAAPVSVRGPRDLEQLGERLEWLRLRLIELEEQKTKFLSQMSHELKTPLASIREGAELLRDGLVGALTASQQEVVEILSRSSKQLQILIEGLLDYHRSQAKKPILITTHFDIKSLAADVLAGFRLAGVSKSLTFDVPTHSLWLWADYDKMRVVLDNLISNAVNYSGEGGAITLSWRVENKFAVLVVSDEGPGIPEAERSSVFEPFFQGSATRKGYVKGSGVGLAVSKEYVLAHDGVIQVVDGEMTGACVEVRLPLGGPEMRNVGTTQT